ncbi:chromosome partitioning protein, ParB family [Izhakiella capsodis]|uniref:Chromosome partitioning protein, ParB family n=1 Tax=Izhakiella capsodis TaxID=1367852 RepID=A0A1I5B8H0_9GAMM|nr:ParB family protein [Izhakiella capsodis]SFN71003.1 chromosome partitioning protein, ParB family [Izhakiella capsodis]
MSREHRKTIGRQLNTQIAVTDSKQDGFEQVLTLKTGKRIKFIYKTIPAADVAERTFVKQETNGRDQTSLTKESLRDIIKTFRSQQFFPCFGVEAADKIEILDGSRRRASAILTHRPLNVMVTSDPLSSDEARQLAKDIQTAKEHNLREVGLRLLLLKDSGLNQKEIAVREGLSPARVTRAIQAAAVPQELIALFPVQSELSYADYKSLLDIDASLKARDISYQQLSENMTAEHDKILGESERPEDEKKADILKLITRISQLLVAAPQKDKSIVLPLWSFDDKDKFARKRIRGRALSYEFNRLPKECLDDIDSAIKEVLARYLSE